MHDTETSIDNDSEEQQESVNAVTSLSVQTETLKVLAQLQEQLKRLTNEVKINKGRAKKRQNYKTPDDASFNRPNTNHYCWTHGMCNHQSNTCTRPAPGHKWDATKDNKQGGSKAFCK